MTGTTLAESPPWPGQRGLLAVCAVLALVGLFVLQGQGARLPALWLVGIALGVTLYHAAFGFTGAYRNLFLRRGSVGVQAQLAMVALATLLFTPLFAYSAYQDAGSYFGGEGRGSTLGRQVHRTSVRQNQLPRPRPFTGADVL